jgi:centromere protein C
MEPIENLFSSPGKSDPEEEDEPSDDFGSGEEPMDLTTSTATPTLTNERKGGFGV